MSRIDADAHVDETESTWEHLEVTGQRFKPASVPVPPGPSQRPERQWRAGTLRLRRPDRDWRRTGVTSASGELVDVGERLRHLDDLRIDVQVLYPTAFLRASFAGHVEAELALTRSYNRWLADRTEASGGRLRWIAVLPLRSMGEALKELAWAKNHGACGVYKKGLECDSKRAGNPYFFPLYEAADDLDVPICVHTGSEGPNVLGRPYDAVVAFEPMVASGVLARHPSLRVGFIEAGASWVPCALENLAANSRRAHLQAVSGDDAVAIDRDLFRRTRLYVACQSHEDLPYLLGFGLEDSLVVGTDYTHADNSAELRALDRIEARAAAGAFAEGVARKIVWDNPRRFYGI